MAAGGPDGAVQVEAKSGPMLRGPERFFRSPSVRERASERERARGLVLGHDDVRDAVSRPDLHSLLALQLRVGVARRAGGRDGAGAALPSH